MNMDRRIKISVCVVTYNQEDTIRQTLDSILAQECESRFEVLVADDKSSDSTPRIIREYAEKYPDIVRPILRAENVGPYRNFVETHMMASGEYICHCDGDDYFLPNKLKAQERVLDSEPSCNVVFHRMRVLGLDGVLREDRYEGLAELPRIRLYRRDLLRFVAVGAHSSKMYRKSLREFTHPGFNVIDYFAHVEHVGDGYARFASCEPLGVYRNGVGISHQGLTVRKALAASFVHFGRKYPQYRLEINTAALTYLVANLRFSLAGSKIFFGSWIRTFHPLAPFNLFRNFKYVAKRRAGNEP